MRLVLKFYRERLGAATSVASANSIIRKDVVSRAFLYFAISITANDIDHLLDAKKVKRGSKSARMLRNGLIHEWNEEDAHEVIEREVEIMDALNLTTNAVCAAASPPSPSADV